jgi:hypothetical protein
MQRNAQFTRAGQFYNNHVGSVEFGYLDANGYIRVSNVLPDQVGKKARKGAIMYDHEHGVMISLNQGELAVMSLLLNDLVSGKRDSLKFSHKSGNSVKEIVFGVDLDGEKNNVFQICASELDRDDLDGEPISNAWYQPDPEEDIEVDGEPRSPMLVVFRLWIDEAIRVSMRGAAHANQIESPRGGNDRGGGYSRGGSDRGGYSRGGSDREEEGDDRGGSDRGSDRGAPRGADRFPRRPRPGGGDRPAEGRPAGGTKLRRPARDEAPGEEDDDNKVPF